MVESATIFTTPGVYPVGSSLIVVVESAQFLLLVSGTRTAGEKCGDIFKNKYNVASPWVEDCKVYKTSKKSNACNKYELSQEKDAATGYPSVLSCEIAEVCITSVETPKCEEFYDS